jgi:hypothetical protein
VLLSDTLLLSAVARDMSLGHARRADAFAILLGVGQSATDGICKDFVILSQEICYPRGLRYGCDSCRLQARRRLHMVQLGQLEGVGRAAVLPLEH